MADDDMRVATSFDTEAEAIGAVESLTLHGIGSLLEPPAPDAEDRLYCVLVVLPDVARACDVLGVEAPTEVEAEIEAARTRRFPDWVYVLIIFAIAMVVLPALAFFVSYKLGGG